MSTAAALELAAGRLRVQATRLDQAITGYVEPAMRLLPQVWVGPAADQLERELIDHRQVLRTVAGQLGARASSLEWQAAEIRAGEMALAAEGISGAL